MDWLETFDSIFGTVFTCDICKNESIYITLECSCKQTMHVCVPCMITDEEKAKAFWKELAAHSRQCSDLGKAVAIAKYMRRNMDNDKPSDE